MFSTKNPTMSLAEGLLSALAAAFAAAGCLPPERDDPIAETQRMIADAERSMRGGPGTPGAPGASSNVLVRIERVRVAADDAAGLSAMWKYANGKVAIAGSDGLGSGGVRLGAAGPEFQTELSAWRQKARNVDRSTDEIVVQSGCDGALWFGKSALVPVLKIATPSGDAVVLQNVEIGAHLVARPRILDSGKIDLQINPAFLVRSGDRQGETLSIEAMSTRVTLDPGQRLVLGASSSASESSVASGLFGYDSRGTRSNTLIILSVERL
jgi:hypothetical protein